MNASKFKEQCLTVLDHLDPEGLIITKHGKPVARLIPADSACRELIGSMKDQIRIHGGIPVYRHRVGCSILIRTSWFRHWRGA